MEKFYIYGKKNKSFNSNFVISYEEPKYKIINTNDDIENIYKDDNFTKCLYFNYKKIDELLYRIYKTIKIKYRQWSKNIPFYFYLILLIIESIDAVNYIYSIDVIKNIINDNSINNYLNKIIKFKIVMILINNCEGFEINSLKNEKEIKKIEKENDKIIEENIIHLKEDINEDMDINYIKSKNIDEIFIDIIISLIKNKKFSNYEETSKILESIDFKNIELNELMLEKLSKILNSNEDYINECMISNINDLFQYKIINFHYILLYYIIKNSMYIYQIQFLSLTRKNIIYFIKNLNLKFGKFPKNILNNEVILKRIKYVIEKYADLKFYINIFNYKPQVNNSTNKIYNKLNYEKEIEQKNTTNYHKTREVAKNNNINKNNKDFKEENNIEKLILSSSNFIIYTKEKKEDPYIIYDKITIGKNHINITEQFLNLIENKNEIKNKNTIKLLEFLDNLSKTIKQEYKHNYCVILELKFEIDKDMPINKDEESLYNISCLYIFYSPIDKKQSTFIDYNILKNYIDSEREGIHYLLEAINDNAFKNIKYIIPESISKIISISIENNNSEVEKDMNKQKESENDIIIPSYNKNYNNNGINNINIKLSTKMELIEGEMNNISSPEEIISYRGIVNRHKKGVESIKQLSKNHYMSYGTENYIKIYNKNLELKLEIKNIEDKIFNICEKKNNNYKTIEIIACCGKHLNLVIIEISNYEYNIKQYEIPEIPCFYYCEMANDNHIISGYPLVVSFKKIFDSENNNTSYKYYKKPFYSGIKINDYQLALTSNSIISKEDNLIIINTQTKKVEKKFIDKYSFVFGPNGLTLINIEKDQIILASCKKYTSYQKNGIFLYEINKINNEKFYDTDSFEVTCICPIDYYNNNNLNDNDIIIKEKFILVAGFNTEIREGKIQLYKLKYNEKDSFYFIEYLQDIEFLDNEEFSGFDMSISCIHQTNLDGRLLIGSLDGNIYLFTKPNLDFYLSRTN